MASEKYDAFLARVLRQAQPEYAFISPGYADDLPAGLVWVMVNALMVEKSISLKKAAQVVHDLCVRRGCDIPKMLNGRMEPEQTEMPEVWH